MEINYNYEEFLANALYGLCNNLNVNIKICEEQMFLDLKKEPDTIYIVYKLVGGDNSTDYKSVPVQIFALSEENSSELARNLMSKFSELFNFYAEKKGTCFVKHSYNQPVTVSNFNQVQLGYRTMLYVAGNLMIMDNIYSLSVVVNNITYNNAISINGEAINILSISFNYSMTPDSQSTQTYEIARSEKSISTLSIAFTIPLTDKTFVKDSLKILNESKSGNTGFTVKFTYGNISFNKVLKIISLQITDAPDKVGTIQVGMML